MAGLGRVRLFAAAGGAAVAVALAWRRWRRRRLPLRLEEMLRGAGDGELRGAAFTARWAAWERAVETQREDALFEDPFASSLGGESGRAFSEEMVALFRSRRRDGWGEAQRAWVAVATRFIDEALAGFAADHASYQVVNLGAGLDARAYRLDCLANCRAFFEVDLPSVAAALRRWTARSEVVLAAACPHVTLSADLADEDADLRRTLLMAGFNPDLPTFWLLQDLTMYLPEAANDRLLDAISGITLAKAALCFTFVAGDDDDAAQGGGALNVPYAPKADDLATRLTRAGWTSLTVHTFGDTTLNFGRYPPQLPPDPRYNLGVASRR